MPAEQPYLVPATIAASAGLTPDHERLSLELTDSFWLYDRGDATVCWLTRSQSRGLPAAIRRAQPAAHRWPTPDRAADLARVVRVVQDGVRPSRHAEVAAAIWDRAATPVPAARELAGTFAAGSGPNCFGTVMGAAGIAGANATWLQREPFEAWLTAQTRPGGRDDQPGTVLIWRDRERTVQHAAVTFGDGWALHKPSQGWMSPRLVLTVRDVIASSRAAGHYIERRTLTPAG